MAWPPVIFKSNLICIRSLSRYSLRNDDTIFLECPKGVMRNTLGARSFHASAPALWNSLPAHIRTIDSLALFKKSLKLIFLASILDSYYNLIGILYFIYLLLFIDSYIIYYY